MKLFISWSGPTSQSIANELRTWFPLILPSVRPFITTTDVQKGAEWQGVIRGELEQSNYGIVILTNANLQSQWLAFEAGALSKHLAGRVATVLFDVKHNDVKPPLSMFQGTIFEKDDFYKLVCNVNRAVAPENQRNEADLETLFPMLWEKLKNPVDLILQNAATTDGAEATPPALDYSALVQEMMALLRQQNTLLSSPERLFGPLIDMLEQRRIVNNPDGVTLNLAPGTGKSLLLSEVLETLRKQQSTKPPE